MDSLMSKTLSKVDWELPLSAALPTEPLDTALVASVAKLE